MIDVFKPMTPVAQRDQRAAYRQFLIERDGTADYERRTLTRREAGMTRFLQPPARLRELDHALFEAQYARFDRNRKTSNEMLLLLTLLKVNAAEAYGVNATFESAKKRAEKQGDDVELRLLIEETYHTRILLSASAWYGLRVTTPYAPPMAFRGLIGGIAVLPELLARPLVLGGEILGTLLFMNLLKYTAVHLAHDPELRDALEERIVEVLIDEIGHISFNRMLMGPIGLAQTRLILPLVAASVESSVPELSQLGLMPREAETSIVELHDSSHLPDIVRKRAFFA